ncbi:unnamed protein product, partial [Closterium sp. NIES-54]
GVMANRGKSVEVVSVDAGAAGQGQAAAAGSTGLDTNFDYVSHAMLTSSNIWVAMAYLVLYLSLDMIGFAGAILENVSLLTLYIVVELIITFISALEALRPFLLFRLLVILLALRLRYCALKVRALHAHAHLSSAGDLLISSPARPRSPLPPFPHFLHDHPSTILTPPVHHILHPCTSPSMHISIHAHLHPCTSSSMHISIHAHLHPSHH